MSATVVKIAPARLQDVPADATPVTAEVVYVSKMRAPSADGDLGDLPDSIFDTVRATLDTQFRGSLTLEDVARNSELEVRPDRCGGDEPDELPSSVSKGACGIKKFDSSRDGVLVVAGGSIATTVGESSSSTIQSKVSAGQSFWGQVGNIERTGKRTGSIVRVAGSSGVDPSFDT